MYKIAILGCENSHANRFLQFIKDGEYADLQVVGIYSNEPEAAARLHEQFDVPVLETYDAAVGLVDGVIITARHGDRHYEYAKPYIASGIPMFIDKPITCTEEDARAFMAEAATAGVRLCGGSSCAHTPETLALREVARNKVYGAIVGGHLACPMFYDSPYGGFFFYAQHLVEVMTTVFGEDVREVRAECGGTGITFTARYDSFNVTGTFVEYMPNGGYYSVSLFGEGGTETRLLTIDDNAFRSEMQAFYELLCGGAMHKSYDSLIRPVLILNAITRALDSGAWERVHA